MISRRSRSASSPAADVALLTAAEKYGLVNWRTDTFTERYGVRTYKCRDEKGEKWDRQLVDENGVAVEDLAAADLNGDGRVDIVAVGRQTHNVRIYWNGGLKANPN